MSWQDVVIAAGQWFFVLTLIPMWNEPPTWKTSVPTGLILAVFAVAFASLGLWNATLSAAAVSAMWGALAIRRIARREA